jgi:hypothetical protein
MGSPKFRFQLFEACRHRVILWHHLFQTDAQCVLPPKQQHHHGREHEQDKYSACQTGCRHFLRVFVGRLQDDRAGDQQQHRTCKIEQDDVQYPVNTRELRREIVEPS